MAICQICGKRSSMGSRQRHGRGVAGRRWAKRAQEVKRKFSPNIQKKTIVIQGETKKMKLCTSCIKKIKKDGKVGKYSNILIA
jgi:large subunit ribosomal protein L28